MLQEGAAEKAPQCLRMNGKCTCLVTVCPRRFLVGLSGTHETAIEQRIAVNLEADEASLDWIPHKPDLKWLCRDHHLCKKCSCRVNAVHDGARRLRA